MIEKTISQLITKLCLSQTDLCRYIGYRLAAMPREYVADNVTKTMAVDGVTLYINASWTLAQPEFKQLFVLLHEGLHVIFMHSKRLADCLPHLQGVVHQAADYCVNLTLEKGRCPYAVPEEALINRSYVDVYGNALNVERIIDKLMQEQQEANDDNAEADPETTDTGTNGDTASNSSDDSAEESTESSGADSEDDSGTDSDGDSGNDSGVESSGQQSGCNDSTPECCGDLLPLPKDADIEAAVERNEQALQLSRAGAGSIPSNLLDDLHQQAQQSETDWLSLFKDRFATAINSSDWSYEKFNQEYALLGMIEPTLYSETVGTIAIAVDESSSMDNDMLNAATHQIAEIIAEWQPERVLIIRHTSEIVDVQELFSGQQPEPREQRAHGGTHFNPVIDMIEENHVEVTCWITDCMPCDSVKDCASPVIWLGTDSDYSEYAHRRYKLQGDYISIC